MNRLDQRASSVGLIDRLNENQFIKLNGKVLVTFDPLKQANTSSLNQSKGFKLDLKRLENPYANLEASQLKHD